MSPAGGNDRDSNLVAERVVTDVEMMLARAGYAPAVFARLRNSRNIRHAVGAID